MFIDISNAIFGTRLSFQKSVLERLEKKFHTRKTLNLWINADIRTDTKGDINTQKAPFEEKIYICIYKKIFMFTKSVHQECPEKCPQKVST